MAGENLVNRQTIVELVSLFHVGILTRFSSAVDVQRIKMKCARIVVQCIVQSVVL